MLLQHTRDLSSRHCTSLEVVAAARAAMRVAAARAVAVRAAAVMAVGARVVGGKEVGTEVKVGGSGAEAAGAHHCNTCCHVSPTGRTGS